MSTRDRSLAGQGPFDVDRQKTHRAVSWSSVKSVAFQKYEGGTRSFSNDRVRLYSRSDISSGPFTVPSVDFSAISAFVINSFEA